MANAQRPPAEWTQTLTHIEPDRDAAAGLCLSILHHPDHSRVGDEVWLEPNSDCLISRLQPRFASAHNAPAAALNDPYISRRGLRILTQGQTRASLDGSDCPTPASLNGEPLSGVVPLTDELLRQGAIITLAERVVMCLQRRQRPTASSNHANDNQYGLIGSGQALRQVREAIARLAPLPLPVLLLGESGTGKELVARALHQHSPRAERPLVAINAAAIPPDLAAAELFGAQRGAYTGSDRHRAGTLQQAADGSLFLDEVGDLPVDVQALLLRVLETHEYQALGGGPTQHFKARLIAATDVDLRSAIAQGRFREALYHRLSAMTIQLPPLRQQRENIGLLLQHLLAQEAQQLKLQARCLQQRPPQDPAWLPAAWFTRLALAPWPGNVRQLRNLARQLLVLGHDRLTIEGDERAAALIDVACAPAQGHTNTQPSPSAITARPESTATAANATDLASLDDDALLQILEQHQWRLLRVAQALQVPRSSLYDRIHRSPALSQALDRSRGRQAQ